MRLASVIVWILGTALGGAGLALAGEVHVGGPVTKNGMQIVANYLTGIAMEPMPKGAAMGANAVHLEVDVHAAKDEPHGFAEDAWIPYLTVTYTIEKVGSTLKKSGRLVAMTAGDGPHYANNVDMGGPGQYHLTYRFEPPSKAGFVRHTDKETGVPGWWQPFELDWTFTYPKAAD
jgi:periplasmic iron binding protein